MKKIIALLLVIGLFGCFALAGDEAPRYERRRPTSVSAVHRGRPDAFKGLDLTDEQKAQIETIKKETGEKIKALIEESQVAIKAVLTDEQVAKLDAAKKASDARREEMKKKYEEMRKRHGDRKPDVKRDGPKHAPKRG